MGKSQKSAESIDEGAERVFAVLSEAQDLARANLVKALTRVFGGLLLLTFLVVADYPLFHLASLIDSLSQHERSTLQVLRWMILACSAVYVFAAAGHAYISWRHTREARLLWHRVDPKGRPYE